MLKPNFLLTKKVPLTLYRRGAGQYVNGIWQDAITTEVAIEANIQPVRDHELLQMPESERSKEWYKVYSDSEIRTQVQGDNGHDADEFDWQGYRYKIMKVRNYAMGTLNHFRAMAARIELTPN
ncbi:hypothetical protein D3C85_880090 [compost metagenome]